MTFLRSLLILAFLPALLLAQTFQASQTQIAIAITPSANHLPVRLPIVAGPGGLSLAGVTVKSDSSWVIPTLDNTGNALVLTFATTGLVNASYTATITLSDGTHSSQVFVNAAVSALNIVGLLDDPTRSLTYGIQQVGLNLGSIVIFDPIQQTYVGSITVGLKPTDLAISADGNELLVICSASQAIYVINLQTLAVTGTIALPVYTDWGPDSTSAHVAYGPGSIIYYTDGAWAPVLHVLDRTTRSILQNVTSGTNLINSGTDFGFGDIVVSGDRTMLFGWAQYGWSAGIASSFVTKFSIKTDGTLTYIANNIPAYPAFARDPLNTPALISADNQTVIVKNLALSSAAIGTTLRTFSSPVYAISPNAEIVCTQSAIYEWATGNKLYDLPVSSTVQAVTSDYARLVYFDATAKALKTVNLLQTLGTTVLGRVTSPANQSITLPPAALQWTPLPGIDRYRVYLGTSSSAVTQAGTGSPEYLGEVTGSSIALATALVPGATYYWRVDSVSGNQVAAGTLMSFTVATIATSVSAVSAATVQGNANTPVSIGLTSAAPGITWTASASAPWVKFANSSGITPASLQVSLDASQLNAGAHQATITITGPDGAFSLPVNLQVDALALTMVRSDPASTMVYAISEAASTGTPHAYLLEIDTLFKTITRVVPVGTGVTDLAIHHRDNRVYVTNWLIGSLLAVNLTSFAVERTYAVTPFAGVGYSTSDVYRISAGGPGRLVTEAEDQWINVSIFNTGTGAVLKSTGEREGGGGYSPEGRYYYHGDDNDSGSELHKLDTLGDTFSEVANASVSGVSYYGDRTVVVSEDGKRIFWNGVAFNPDLTAQWSIGDIIYCASGDGRYAFSKTKIYDVTQKQTVMAMPVSTTVSAYNSATGRLVAQNGTALGFYSLVGPGLLGNAMSPQNQAVILPPTSLQWSALPGATGYRVYLGTSLAAVTQAGTGSAEYLGTVTSPSLSFGTPPAVGQYYWRVDLVMAGGAVATGNVASFAVATIASSVTSVSATTVQGDPGYPVSINLTSAAPGASWTASANASWVKLAATTGTTPSTLQLALDATQLSPGLNQASITLNAGTATYTIPVSLQVDALTLTAIRSDPASTKVYAISEAAVTSGTSRAYLLEIDTLFKAITRVVPVGTGVTDLTIHHGDNRVYVTNWLIGSLLAVNLGSFTIERTYAVTPYGAYNSNDVYRISAGGPGRLVVEAEDQWINVSIFNTGTGAVLASAFEREGGGGYSPEGRYYYHGDDNDSGSELHKLDTLGDTFSEVAHATVSGVSYYGDRTVVVSEDGKRIFWNGVAFNPDLTVQWSIGDIIYSASGDGRYAFSKTKIYDVTQKQSLMAMPVSTTVSAYNSATGRLVAQNGTALGFYSLVGPGLLGNAMSPQNQAVILPPSSLQWSALPGATGYRVYLGTSLAAVTQAGTGSAEYLGTVSSPTLSFATPLAVGQYYWRVDPVIAGGAVATGNVASFAVATIAASVTSVNATTVQGDPGYPVSISLTSAAPGASWTASANASWVKLAAATGTTPATLQLALDATQLSPGLNQASITIGAGAATYTIPVSLQVDALTLTAMRSDPASTKVYAISEAAVTSGTSRAYLLEIDSLFQTITRVVPVGTGVTDLAIHHGDNRVYVTNWLIGSLLAVNLTSFAVERTYAVPPFAGVGYSTSDVYRISAGGPGRLMVEAEDQWINVSIFNTATGVVLKSTNERYGGGGYSPDGRYYYHGAGDISTINKLDTTGDTFAQVAQASGGGGRSVVVAENGALIFWGGAAFNPDLTVQWSIGDIIYSASGDGRYAFSQTKIYDVMLKQAVLAMPVSTTVSAFNSTTGKLVVQQGSALGFYPVSETFLPAPVLSVTATTATSASLVWTDTALESSLTLQMRVAGASSWTDVSSALAANLTTYTVTGLASATSYEFRVKADSPLASSAWSNTAATTTPAVPPPTPTFNPPAASGSFAVTLSWSVSGNYSSIVIERSPNGTDSWTTIATLASGTNQYTDNLVAAATTYYYRIKTTLNGVASTYSTVRSVTTPGVAPTTTPTNLSAVPLGTGSVGVTWNNVSNETGYRLERRLDGSSTWTAVATLPTDTTTYTDTGLTVGTKYWYHVQAFNTAGSSAFTSDASVTPATYTPLLADNFDPALKPAVWQSVTGGSVMSGTTGFPGSNVLHFGAAGTRLAATVPVDLSNGGHVVFRMRAGNTTTDGSTYWENSDAGEGVVLEYSLDGGSTWTTLQSTDTLYPALSNWAVFDVAVPAAACSAHTSFRWRQLSNSGLNFDAWALDDIYVQSVAPALPTAPTFVLASPSSDTSVAVLWQGATGTIASYSVERSVDGTNWTAISSTASSASYYTDTALVPSTWYAYRVKAVNGAGSSGASPVAWVQTYTQMAEWCLANYGTVQPTGRASSTAADVDGVKNLAKFAFNLPVGQQSIVQAVGTGTQGLPAIWLDSASGKLCVEFVRRKSSGNPNISYVVEFSTDLVTWTAGGTVVQLQPIDGTWERVRYQDDVTGLPARRFARVRIVSGN